MSGTKRHTQNYEASIRDALEKGCKESVKYDGQTPLFYMVEGKYRGHYGLINYESIELDYTQEDDEFSEGKALLKKHLARERNQFLITKAKRLFRELHGNLFCEICGLDFSRVYGELGEGFIEAHHIKPVSQMNDGEKTVITDIIMVCSNCHSMLHRAKPWVSASNLRSILLNKR